MTVWLNSASTVLTAAVVVRAWGAMADRFSTLAVLRVSCAVFLLAVACWPVVGQAGAPWLVIGGLSVIHILSGLSTAGVNLGSGTVAMELAPRGAAAGYLATNALITGAASALAPILGGLSADWLETQRLSMTLAWTSTAGAGEGLALPIAIHGLDFLFLATAVVGLYAIHRLLAVTARATARRREVLGALFVEMRDQMPQPLRAITTVPAVRDLVYFPFSLLGSLLPERRQREGAVGPDGGMVAAPVSGGRRVSDPR